MRRVVGGCVVWCLALLGGAGGSVVAAVPPAAEGSASVAGRIFTVMGTSWEGPRDGAALGTGWTGHADAVAVEADGSFVVATGPQVWRVRASGRMFRVAGRSWGFSGDGGPATKADLDSPEDLAVLPDGGFLIADSGNERVRRVWPDGTITTVAGTGTGGFSGDGGAATAAQLSPRSLAVLPDGGFLIASGDRVRRVWPDGTITTVAGSGTDISDFTGDGGPATAAQLDSPEGVAVLPDGGFLIADWLDERVRRVWPDGTITTAAGTGTEGSSGDGGPATTAALSNPVGVAVLPDGGFLIGEDDRVRRVWPDGTITTVAGSGNQTYVFSGDGGPATAASMPLGDLAVLPDGGLLVADGSSVRLVVGPSGTDMLAAAIRPRLGTAWARGYSVHTALTKPAQLTVRLYRSPKAPPSLTTHAPAPAGDSTVVAKRRRALTPGVYAVDLRADADGQATRAVDYIYLGGRLTKKTVMELPTDPADPGIAPARRPLAHTADENPTHHTTRCHRFSKARIDCVIVSTYDTPKPGECSWLSSHQLAPNGQIAARSYSCPPRRKTSPFKRHPHWHKGRSWCNLSFIWTWPNARR